jgi:hypothetical protein
MCGMEGVPDGEVAAAKASISPDEDAKASLRSEQQQAPEIGGPHGPEPTRYGDWERKGRCIDF